MYTDYFGLSDSPFSIAPNPQFLFMSDRHREALAHLTYGLGETGGFVLLTGEVGTGKTTVSRCLLEQLPENTQAAFILNPTLSAQELLATICDELKIRYRKTGATLKTLTDKIQEKLLKNHAAELNTVLIIDEAQHLKAEVLEQLRLLTNLETNTKKLLQVILIGQPELQQLLQRRDLRQLAQRITARYHLLPLNKLEVEHYIRHRLSVVNCQQALFTPSAIRTIHKLSKGIPRLINLICDRALLGAYGANKSQVDRKLVLGACQEALGVEYQPKPWWQHKLALVAGGLSVVTVLGALGYGLGYWLYADQPSARPSAGLSDNDKAQLSEQQAHKSTLQTQNWQIIANQHQDLGLAVEQLFQSWRVVLDETITEPCQLAQYYDLACYWHKGNLNSLAKLNYPAVLKLYDQQGRAFYGNYQGQVGIPRGASGEQVSLAQDNNILELADVNFGQMGYQLDYAWFNRYWRGAALVFWPAPKNNAGEFVEQIDQGSELALIQWLEQKLSEQQQRPARQISEFDPRLVNQLQQYQRERGLVLADYADTATLLSLANTVEQGFPVFLKQASK